MIEKTKSSSSTILSTFLKTKLEFSLSVFTDVFGISFVLTESAIMLMSSEIELKSIIAPIENPTPLFTLLDSNFSSYDCNFFYSNSVEESENNLMNYILINGEKGNIFNIEITRITRFQISGVILSESFKRLFIFKYKMIFL